MWLAVGKFFSMVVQFILGIFTGILKWAKDHPRELVIVLVSIALLIATAFYTHKWTEEKVKAEDAKVISSLQEQVKKANAETALRDEKIKRIESESKAHAEQLSTALQASQSKAKAIVSEYEKKLEVERGKYKIIHVKDNDGKDVKVQLDPQGDVVCEKFSQTFSDTVNKLVDNANAPLTFTQPATK